MVKESTANAGDARDTGSVPGLGRSPAEGNGHAPQYSCLENPTDRGGWQGTVHSVAQSSRLKRLSNRFSLFSQASKKTSLGFFLRGTGLKLSLNFCVKVKFFYCLEANVLRY